MASASGPSTSAALGPMPRMTDSTQGPGTGPQSLKLAALSVQSYQLDSPPFIGTAIGGGGPNDPFAEAGRNLLEAQDQRRRSSVAMQRRSSLKESEAMSDDDSEPSNGLSYLNETPGSGPSRQWSTDEDVISNRSQSRRREHSAASARTGPLDGDVPQLNLNEGGGSGGAAPPRHRAVAQASVQTAASRSHSRASSQAGAKLDGASAAAAGEQALLDCSSSDAGPSSQQPYLFTHSRRNPHARRPDYSQLAEDPDGLGEESSSGANGEGDDEVDGDETGFVLRQPAGGRGEAGKVPVQTTRKEEYAFPKHRLPLKMRDESKTPLVIVACGSFSPPTYLHLRIFEMAKDAVIEGGKYELLGGYYSPVSDYYKKEGLAKATHRVRMCELAVEKTSTWLMVDAWESLQDEYQRTAVVLDHFDEEINGGDEGGIQLADGTRRRIRIMLLAGGDLIQSMGEPGVWADRDLHHILGRYGCMIVERTGADVWSFLLSHDLLWKYRRNLKVVKQVVYNDISSSKVRLFVRRGQSIKYLLPNSVINYIERHQLYRLPPEEVDLPDQASDADDPKKW